MRIDLNRNDYLFYSVSRLLKIYFLIVAILMSFRTGFVLYFANKEVYSDYFSDLIYAYYMGWRYDSIAATYLLILPFLGFWFSSLLNSRKLFNLTNWLSSIWIYLSIILVLFISISDLGFYSFFQDHINILFFGLFEDDTTALMKSIWKNYPLEYALVAFVIALIIFFFYLKWSFKFIHDKTASLIQPGFLKFLMISIVLFVLFLGGARGGFGIMVLAPKYADFSKNLFVNQTALNGLVTLERAYKLRRERAGDDFNMANIMGYGKNIHAAYSDYLGLDVTPTSEEFLTTLLERKTPINDKVEKSKPNVIVILMESMGGHWSQYNSSEFDFLGPLQAHFNEDLYFKNFISSGNGTIGSLMVVASNIPYRKGARFLSESRYMQLPLNCAAHVPYKDSGYETSFVYGGKLGWRDVGQYFTHQGYHHVEGENHIRDSLKLEGEQGTEWGLYDEHFFNHIKLKLETAKRPQFVLALSTSNHPPFEFPKDFKGSELKLPKELESRIAREKDLFLLRFKAFQYANYKLAQFISEIKNSNLGKNTIIAITGDHNFWGFMNYGKEEAFSKFTVPFYLYIPDDLKPKNPNLDKFGSHEDILPTLYNLSLSQVPYVAFGEDLFGTNKSIAMNGEIYASEEGVLWDEKTYAWDKIPLIKSDGPSPDLKNLTLQIKSTLTVSDHYLRESFLKANKSSQ